MPNHRLPKQAWNIGCKLQKIIREIFSHLVRCLRLKWFNIWGVNDLLELTHHAMKYVITKDILLEALRMKWQDTKMSKMKYNIANANHQWWAQYKVNVSKCLQLQLTTPMSLGSHRTLTLLQTWSHKLSVEIASWNHHPNMKIYKVWNENLVEDEYHLLLASSKYKVIHEKYGDVPDGHDKLSFKSPQSRVSTCVWIIFTYGVFTTK